ncbi:MAG: nicotinate-nucleotide adenylyltransferase [Chromatiales bacterium]|nr:nicotinate-nucleotide adenylyltransferase [Chromatiales bacterium]
MIGVYGGTFDPIHYGHLRPALEIYQRLALTQIRFIPARNPPHRGIPSASAEQRMAMLRLAIEGQPGFVADDRELRRPGPSYMVDTLRSLREDFPDQPLALILGLDAFLGLPGWNRWEQLPDLAHLIVSRRPGCRSRWPEPLEPFVRSRMVGEPRELNTGPEGRLLFLDTVQLEISATAIRTQIAEGDDPRFLLPDTVLDYIRREGLYGIV